MSESREEWLAKSAGEADRKFDYFITGLTGAALAYMIKDIQPVKLGWNSFTIQVVALICLSVSGYYGILRLESHTLLLKLNSTALREGSEASEVAKAIRGGGTVVLESTGEMMDSSELNRLHGKKSHDSMMATASFEQTADESARLYRARNKTLGIALLLLITAKVVHPYIG